MRRNLCAVPETLPIDPEGAQAPAAQRRPLLHLCSTSPVERLVLERNRFYARRPSHITSTASSSPSEADAGSLLDRVRAGQLDYACVTPSDYAAAQRRASRASTASTRRRFFIDAGASLRMFVLNTSRPLFRNNPKLRQAVNFAVDRKAILRERGPLAGYAHRPVPAACSCPASETSASTRSRRLTWRGQSSSPRGTPRSGKAVLYTCELVPRLVAQAQVLSANLKEIGLEVEIEPFPSGVLFSKLGDAGRAVRHRLGRLDRHRSPTATRSSTGCSTAARSRTRPTSGTSPTSTRRSTTGCSSRPRDSRTGTERDRGVRRARRGHLEERSAGDPVLLRQHRSRLVSARTGCVVINPELDLTAVCLK